VLIDVGALTRFSEFLATIAPGVDTLADIDRPLLERYLAWIATQPTGSRHQRGRRHRPSHLLPGDPPARLGRRSARHGAVLTRRHPPAPAAAGPHLAEHVMAQVEAPANLDRWPNPDGRLVTLILIRCGLRASDACTLAFDCLLHDGQGAPYLRYFNHKMHREAAVPIDEELEAEIRSQQRRVTQRWPDAHPHLFPGRKGNADGRRNLTYYSYRISLNRWLATCDIRDEHGQPARLTPHQWRHTFASRLINRDVPQEVVRVLLDHESTQMTAHYARLTDQTVRRRWEQATKVNINGERVGIDPDGPLGQAQWPRPVMAWPPRPCRTATAGCPCRRAARTPTPA